MARLFNPLWLEEPECSVAVLVLAMVAETQPDRLLADTNHQSTKVQTFKIDWMLVAFIGLLVQTFWVWQLEQPSYMDAFYYATNGQRLADGYGFSELVIWQFLDDPVGIPTPSHTYWMPLPSLLAAAGYSLRDDFTGGQLAFWLLAGLLPLLAYIISWRLVGQRWQAWVAAIFTTVAGYYAAFLGQPSTFAPFAWAGGSCLLALGLAASNSSTRELIQPNEGIKPKTKRKHWWLVAGVTAGFAHLTRADGSLLLLVACLIWLIEAWGLWKRRRDQPEHMSLSETSVVLSYKLFSHFALLISGYFLVMGWWFIRNWIVLGRPLSTAGMQSIFLTTYDDLFAYGRVIGLQSFLDWGWSNIILSRIQGSWLAIQTLIAIPGLIFLVPFILVAFIHLYRRLSSRYLLRPLLFYTLTLFLSAALVFTFPGTRGSLFHSSIALWPWTTALAAAGIGLSVDLAADRLSHWQPERAKRIFSGLFILVALILTIFVSQYRISPPEEPEIYREVSQIVPATSVVMAGNAPALHYFTGLPAVSVPNEAVEVMLQAADRYGVTHLLLNENRPRPLDDVYQGKVVHPRLQLIWSSDQAKLYEVGTLPE